MSSESSSSSSEGSNSESSSKSVSLESRSIRSEDDPVESGNYPRSVGGPESSLPPEFSRFAVNRIKENRINNTKLTVFREEFSIPSDVGLRILNMGEQVSNPEPGCVAIHPAFLDIGIWTRLTGHSLITRLPSSNKEWKKTWFVATTEWGRELTIGGKSRELDRYSILQALTVKECDHINSACGTRSDHRHIDHLLDVRVLASVNIIPEPSSLRLANSKRSFGKKKVAPSRKGKLVASKRPRRTLPKASLRAKIPEEFIKKVSSKRAHTTIETSDPVLPEQEVPGGVDPLSAMPPVPPRGSKQRSCSPSAFYRPPMGSGVPPTFTSARPGVSQFSVDAIFSPNQSVDFICDNARNFIKSTDPGVTGKISNDYRIRIATRKFYTAIGNFHHQEMRLVELHHQLEHTEAELIHKKDMLSWAKAEEYRGRLKDALRLITRLQNELPDRVIDRFVKSSEYMKAINDKFQRGSLDTQNLVSKVDPNFDFEKFEEIKAAEWGTREAANKADSPEEEEDSLLVADVGLSGEEVEEVGSGGETTDHFDSVGLPDHFDRRLVPYDFLIVIGGWSLLDHFVRGFYLSVASIIEANFAKASTWEFLSLDILVNLHSRNLLLNQAEGLEPKPRTMLCYWLPEIRNGGPIGLSYHSVYSVVTGPQGLGQHVINIHFHVSPDLSFEHAIHQPLVCHSSCEPLLLGLFLACLGGSMQRCPSIQLRDLSVFFGYLKEETPRRGSSSEVGPHVWRCALRVPQDFLSVWRLHPWDQGSKLLLYLTHP
ncbi:hypothetical protein ACOSQ2_008309 [Xanthoceras sorbifolium]